MIRLDAYPVAVVQPRPRRVEGGSISLVIIELDLNHHHRSVSLPKITRREKAVAIYGDTLRSTAIVTPLVGTVQVVARVGCGAIIDLAQHRRAVIIELRAWLRLRADTHGACKEGGSSKEYLLPRIGEARAGGHGDQVERAEEEEEKNLEP